MGAVLKATIDFSNGAVFDPSLILDNPATPLDSSVLGTSANEVIDVSQYVLKAQVRRAYNRNQDSFVGGGATLRLIDETGLFNPENPSSVIYGKILPLRKIRLQGTYLGNTYTVFSGYIQSWNYQSPSGFDPAFVDIVAVDGFQLLNLTTLGTFATGTAGQTTAQRITALLDAADWPGGMRDISNTATTTVQADPQTAGRSALAAIQLIEQTELGSFLFDEFGYANFYSRADIATAQAGTPTIFTDAGSGGISYEKVSFDLSDTGLVNYASVTRSGGSAQVTFDQTSIDQFYNHSKIRSGLLMQSDTDALNQAQMIVASRKDISEQLRMQALLIDAFDDDDPARIVAALELDIYSPIQVTQTLPGGSVTSNLVIQGTVHTITPQSWFTEFLVGQSYVAGFFVLDSSTSGVLGTNVLGY
jgi:hypothetical protein